MREQKERSVIEQEKARLLAMHGDILMQFNPKATSAYGQFLQQ